MLYWTDLLSNVNIRAVTTVTLAVLQLLATNANLITGSEGIGATMPAKDTPQLQPPAIWWALLYPGVLLYAAWQWLNRGTNKLANETSLPAAAAFGFLAVWSLLASGTHAPNALAVQLSLLILIIFVEAALFVAVVSASNPAILSPQELLCCGAPLSLLFGWLFVATALLLCNVIQLFGLVSLSVASNNQVLPAIMGTTFAVIASWLLSCKGPMPGNFWVAGTVCWGLLGSSVSASKVSKPILQTVLSVGILVVLACCVTGTTKPPKWGWASTGALWLCHLVVPFHENEEAIPLVN